VPPIGRKELVEGLDRLGLRDAAVVVHASMRSFGSVAGGAEAVCAALTAVCGTVLAPAFAWSRTGIRCPPGLNRPWNACTPAESWAEFDAALAAAVPFSTGLPVDRELGVLPEVLRRTTSPAAGTTRCCRCSPWATARTT
jgi:aminoglycoside 3-N-acetyltransferase